MDEGQALLRRLEELAPAERQVLLDGVPEAAVLAFCHDWPSWAHAGQAPPDDPSTGSGQANWRVWVMLAGRGFGKTRAGAEWVSRVARETPDARIALVGASAAEARAVMIEGRSGLLAVARAGRERQDMLWQPSLGRLSFASGAEAFVYSAANPEGLRGPEHHIAWCDELAKWRQGKAAWDNLTLGLRLGTRPRALVTTTPKPVAALKAILAEDGVVLTGGASRANPHLPAAFIAAVERIHGGTRFGRQELEGALIEDPEGALWSRELIERSRHGGPRPREGLRRVVIGVDPPASAHGNACGIVACGLGEDGIGYVLGDHSIGGVSPEGWARKVAAAAETWRADHEHVRTSPGSSQRCWGHRDVLIVAEANNGGAMVESVLRGAGLRLPVKRVHAATGKAARAEPVATLFESGQAKLAGYFPELEDELAGLTIAGGYEGPTRSPDRADAMVWALTELMLGTAAREPRVLML